MAVVLKDGVVKFFSFPRSSVGTRKCYFWWYLCFLCFLC